MNRGRHNMDADTLKRVRKLLNENSEARGADRNRRKWKPGAAALANTIWNAQDDLTSQGGYKAEMAGAIKRIKADHTREILTESKQLQLTNQAKRDAELNRRMTIDSQRNAFDDDLKTINQKMADLEIEIEYNRNMLKIQLAEIAGAANKVW